MQKVLNFILSAGISPTTRAYLIPNLKATAIVNILLLTFLIAFVGIFAFTAPALIPLMIFGILTILTSSILLYLGMHIIARSITGIFVCIIALVVHNVIAAQVHSIVPFTFATCTLFVLSPLFLFSISELRFAAIALIINITALLAAPLTIHYFVVKDDVSTLNGAPLQTLILMIGIFMLGGSTIALQALNRKEAIKARGLLKKVEQDNLIAAEKERKLNGLIEQLQVAQLDEQKRIWATKGLADAARILREETDETKIGDKLLAFLVKYIDANQGAMFVLRKESDTEYFELTSCYAYDRKKYVDGKIGLGEGLLGECYYEKNYIHLTQVPKNYTRITSGLGEATPRSILIIPLLSNDTLCGAIEFASFNVFEKHQIDFLMEVGENTASVFNTLAANLQTKSLLIETQQMTEQMKAQEEEMRQNMEELAATQEQQSRLENELRTALAKKDSEIESLQKKMKYLKEQLQVSVSENELE